MEQVQEILPNALTMTVEIHNTVYQLIYHQLPLPNTPLSLLSAAGYLSIHYPTQAYYQTRWTWG